MNVRSLSKEQVRAVLAEARACRMRDWLMYLVAYHHGLRSSEVVALTRDSIRDGFLTVARLKGSNRTTHPLIASEDPVFSEREAVVDFAKNLPNSSRIFPITRRQYSRLFHRYAVRAGIPEHLAFAHILKHSICMHSIKIAGLENVRQYVGHKSISSTGAYLKVSDEQASEAVQRSLKF